MKINFQKLKPYKNKWVALSNDREEVLASGNTLKEVKEKADKTGQKYLFFKVLPYDLSRMFFTPFIPIKAIGPKGVWEGYALIDQGSNRSFFHIEIAKLIGIDLTKGKPGYCENGHLIIPYPDPVKIQVRSFQEIIKIPVDFTDNSEASAFLGEEGFLDTYDIEYIKDKAKNKEIIKIKRREF